MIRNYLPRSLMGRTLLIVVTPLVILQMVTAYVFYESHWDQVSKRLSLGLAGDIVMLTEALRELPDLKSREWLFQAAARSMEIKSSLDPGAILPNATTDVTQLEGELYRALRSKEIDRPVRVDAQSRSTKVIVYVQLPEGILTFVTLRARLFSKTTYIFVLWTLGTSLILLGLAAMFMRNQVQPILRLAHAAENFGKGRDVPSFKPEGAREVRRAAMAFIAMRSRILRQITQRTAMLAGVSHDLRTPLTRMRLQLEMMGEGESVSALKEDVAEMERMLEGYLAFARGEGSEKPEPLDVGELLDDAVRQARRKGSSIDLRVEGEVVMPLRPNAFLRCITNLLENAARYASHVSVTARRLKKTVEIVIDDNGPGIPESQREEVFKPFFRLEGSRNPETGGVGLGLTIARDVARGHGGDIVLGDSPSGGLRVRIQLPL